MESVIVCGGVVLIVEEVGVWRSSFENRGSWNRDVFVRVIVRGGLRKESLREC